jgi:Rrf2 family protein
MLSMKAKYAIRALLVMAKSSGGVLQSKAIAEEADVPAKFLENILQELRHHGMVESRRGILGGYLLAKPPAEIMVGTLVRILDGPLAPIRCASITAYEKCDDCADENTCAIRKTMLEVRNAIADVLDHKSLAQMMETAGVCVAPGV